MTERPILFSARDVRALLDRLKTQDRRPVMPQPVDPYTGRDLPAGARPDSLPACPYGVPGDRLWVRETFASYREDGPSRPATASYVVLPDGTQVYRSGETYAPLPEYAPGSSDGIKWRPSIHMPRWAARLVLEVTSVRVERLQAITEADAVAEGHLARVHPAEWTALRPLPGFAGTLTAFGREPSASVIAELGLTRVRYKPERVTSARDRFRLRHLETSPGRRLWRSNPWVWVLGLKRVTP